MLKAYGALPGVSALLPIVADIFRGDTRKIETLFQALHSDPDLHWITSTFLCENLFTTLLGERVFSDCLNPRLILGVYEALSQPAQAVFLTSQNLKPTSTQIWEFLDRYVQDRGENQPCLNSVLVFIRLFEEAHDHCQECEGLKICVLSQMTALSKGAKAELDLARQVALRLAQSELQAEKERLKAAILTNWDRFLQQEIPGMSKALVPSLYFTCMVYTKTPENVSEFAPLQTLAADELRALKNDLRFVSSRTSLCYADDMVIFKSDCGISVRVPLCAHNGVLVLVPRLITPADHSEQTYLAHARNLLNRNVGSKTHCIMPMRPDTSPGAKAASKTVKPTPKLGVPAVRTGRDGKAQQDALAEQGKLRGEVQALFSTVGASLSCSEEEAYSLTFNSKGSLSSGCISQFFSSLENKVGRLKAASSPEAKTMVLVKLIDTLVAEKNAGHGFLALIAAEGRRLEIREQQESETQLATRRKTEAFHSRFEALKQDVKAAKFILTREGLEAILTQYGVWVATTDASVAALRDKAMTAYSHLIHELVSNAILGALNESRARLIAVVGFCAESCTKMGFNIDLRDKGTLVRALDQRLNPGWNVRTFTAYPTPEFVGQLHELGIPLTVASRAFDRTTLGLLLVLGLVSLLILLYLGCHEVWSYLFGDSDQAPPPRPPFEPQPCVPCVPTRNVSSLYQHPEFGVGKLEGGVDHLFQPCGKVTFTSHDTPPVRLSGIQMQNGFEGTVMDQRSLQARTGSFDLDFRPSGPGKTLSLVPGRPQLGYSAEMYGSTLAPGSEFSASVDGETCLTATVGPESNLMDIVTRYPGSENVQLRLTTFSQKLIEGKLYDLDGNMLYEGQFETVESPRTWEGQGLRVLDIVSGSMPSKKGAFPGEGVSGAFNAVPFSENNNRVITAVHVVMESGEEFSLPMPRSCLQP